MKTKKIQEFRDEVQALKNEIQAMKKSHADETNALIESYKMKIATNQRMHESEISAIKDEHEQEMRTANEKIAQLQNQLETQVEENNPFFPYSRRKFVYNVIFSAIVKIRHKLKIFGLIFLIYVL